MDSVKIRIGGVPEHYNLPIHLAEEKGAFSKRGIELEWTDFGGGTGQMTRALRDDEVDVCILLTEGVIADIINGNPCKIISEYVLTPLTWGVHTGTENALEDYRNIYDKQYAISRFGSGSHLMAIVDAESKGYKLDKDQFSIIKDIKGALPSLANNDTDVFYWEKYTTQPFVDQGKVKRIGEYRTPWPCFVIAARDEILQKYPEHIIRMLRIIHDQCDQFMENMDAPAIVASRYGLEVGDTERWFNSTEWAIHGWVSDKMIENVIYHLKTAEIIDSNAGVPELIWKRN